MNATAPAWRRFTLLATLIAIGLVYIAAFALFRARSTDFIAVRLDGGARDHARVPATELPQKIAFGAELPTLAQLGDGWWPADEHGIWSRRERANVFLRRQRAAGELQLTFEGDVFVTEGRAQHLRAYVDGTLLGEWPVPREAASVRKTVSLSAQPAADGVLALVFEVDYVDSPFRTSDSRDNRRLGFHLRLVELHD